MSKHRIENATLPFKELQTRLEREQAYKENPFRAMVEDAVGWYTKAIFLSILAK